MSYISFITVELETVYGDWVSITEDVCHSACDAADLILHYKTEYKSDEKFKYRLQIREEISTTSVFDI